MASIQGESQCPPASGYCLARDAADSLGIEVYETLMTFIWGAEPESRLILEKGRTAFSVEISGAPRTGPDSEIDSEHMRQLRERLKTIRKIRPEE